MSIITISRQLGAGGDTIALKVAESLEYQLIDKKIIQEVAKRAGVTVEKALALDEKYKPKTIEWLMTLINPKTGKILISEERHLDAKSYVEHLKSVVIGIYELDNAVIVGRGSQFILHGFENVFQVRIIADDKYRIGRVSNYYNVSDSEAWGIIKKTDNARRSFVSNYLNADWENPKWYHMILNSGRLGIEQTVEIIVNSVKRFSTYNEYIPEIKNRRKMERRSLMERRSNIDRPSGNEIWVSKDNENALMRGRSVRSYTSIERRKRERRAGERRDIKDK